VKANEVDFIADSGTETGNCSERDMAILRDLRDELASLEGVSGHTITSKQVGDSIFGKTRVLNRRTGSVLVSQYESGAFYKWYTPDRDTMVLEGWPGSDIAGKSWYFIRDRDRYGDNLLHCTLPIGTAKAFVSKGAQKFYNPTMVPVVDTVQGKKTIDRVQIVHRMYNHASANELIRRVNAGVGNLDITVEDIKYWKSNYGDFCTGCLQGKMTEHKRVSSTKPSKATEPGEVGEGDLMFIEGRHDVKDPFYLHVDVATKCIIGVPVSGEDKPNMQEAIRAVAAIHKRNGHQLKTLVFDRESSIVASEIEIADMGIRVEPKSAGQKAAIAEVGIRYAREKGRSTKAEVMTTQGYVPPPHFNKYLMLDTISVQNRIPKEGESLSPYEKFTGKQLDHLRDMRGEWGEIVIVKKPKGISSDLRPVGEWAVIVRRMMDGSGVIMVYLVVSKKFAFRLKFKRATPPGWVIALLNAISPGALIGLEDISQAPEAIVAADTNTQVATITNQPTAVEVVRNDEESDDDEAVEPAVEEAIQQVDALEEEGDLVADEHQEEVKQPIVNRRDEGPVTRSTVDDVERLELEREAENYAEYVARGWRDPEQQDVGKVVFGKGNPRTDANLARANGVLKEAYLSIGASYLTSSTMILSSYAKRVTSFTKRPCVREAVL
jgi:hypothetical protein